MNIRKRKAISPLITTLLLIAIAVAASVLTYSWVMSMVGSQSAQAQTQVRVENVNWHGAAGTPNTAASYEVVIRNTGSVAATVESISIRKNIGGEQTIVGTLPTTGLSFEVGNSHSLTIAYTGWIVNQSYVIRVTTTTGFYYEAVATTPATIPAS